MTAENFCIVLNDSLVSGPIATELLKQLPTYAPHLVRYLDQCQSEKTTIELSQAKCTAFEYWQLEDAGFTASMAKHNAALALLLASEQKKLTKIAADAPLWLVELVHISPARDGAALLPASALALEPAHNEALLQSAQALCEGTPFRLSAWSETHWQLHSDSNHELPPTFASSALVSRMTVNDWWDQDARSRDWRRFVNEVQMLYFDHPVNSSRQQQGLPPINSLWPVGGLRPVTWQPTPPNPRHAVFNALSESYLRQDWGQWLLELQKIEAKIASLLQNPASPPHLILTNTTEYLCASAQAPRFWQRFSPFKSSTPSWRNHWLAQS